MFINFNPVCHQLKKNYNAIVEPQVLRSSVAGFGDEGVSDEGGGGGSGGGDGASVLLSAI